MKQPYDYQILLEASERVQWSMEDVLGDDSKLNFHRNFMPAALARADDLAFLDRYERRVLNHIRGNEYLSLFALAEEFILPYLVDQVEPLEQNDAQVRALLQFAGEEAKHIDLFKHFKQEFDAGFGHECEVIGPGDEIARKVLSHHPLAVLLIILQFEFMTQAHYMEVVHAERDLDRRFRSLIKSHWMEEAQHAKLDLLMLGDWMARCDQEDIEQGVNDYFRILKFFDKMLAQQTEFNLSTFERAAHRPLMPNEAKEFAMIQRQATRWTYLGSGFVHPKFLSALESVMPEARYRVERLAPRFAMPTAA